MTPPRPACRSCGGTSTVPLMSGRLSSILLTAVHKCLDACHDDAVIPSARARRSPVDKFDERRNELAESALLTLGELGYARTSLREIASNSPFSHGVLHYYFADKLELVIYSVTLLQGALRHPLRRGGRGVDHRAGAARRLRGQAGRDDRRRGADAPASGTTCGSRACSTSGSARRSLLIDKTLEDMIWRIVTRYAELADRPPAMDPAVGVRRARRAVPGRAARPRRRRRGGAADAGRTRCTR